MPAKNPTIKMQELKNHYGMNHLHAKAVEKAVADFNKSKIDLTRFVDEYLLPYMERHLAFMQSSTQHDVYSHEVYKRVLAEIKKGVGEKKSLIPLMKKLARECEGHEKRIDRFFQKGKVATEHEGQWRAYRELLDHVQGSLDVFNIV